MLTYTTQLKKLILPEYGRNIQRMVDHCLTIEDRAERTRCAATIVRAMETLFPSQGNTDAYRRKLWDHLAIMSDFKLDVDVPFELIRPDTLDEQPSHIGYDQKEFGYRHYGQLIQRSIAHAVGMPDGEEKDALILLLADHMKKTLMAVNPDGADDEKVFKDLFEMSHGAIRIDPELIKLHDFKVVVPVTGKKKKKK